MTGLDQVAHDRDGAEDGPTNPAGKTDNFSRAIADSRNAMKRSFDTGSIVPAKRSDAFRNKGQILAVDFPIAERHFPILEPCLWRPPQVHDDLDQIVVALMTPGLCNGLRDPRRKHRQQNVEIVGALELVPGAEQLARRISMRLARYIRCF
ncbi:MAG TPA: hypothetical protein VFQ33_15395 [Xanthobacteraceae bacterium]|nr:hypothetical protein [Xanthobacteraceae bacterium]